MASPPATGETSGPHPSRRRMWILAGMAAAALAAVVLVSQLGGGGSAAPLNAVAAAAAKTSEEPGGRAVLHLVASSASGKPLTVSARSVFDADGRTRAVMEVRPAGSHTASRVEGIADGAVIYMSSPTLPVPEGRKWMKIDFGAAVGLKLPVPAGTDPRSDLGFLNSAGDVRKLGKEDVRGVPTTSYRGTAGVAETVQRLREEGEGEFAETIEKTGSPMHFEVWIDSGGLVRRLRILHLHTPGEGDEADAEMSAEFFDFGLEPQIEIPDSSEVFDATSLAESS